ncbi:MAG: chorismate synthase [Acholeplasmataceae bacterium]|jgi:chorismate synthase
MNSIFNGKKIKLTIFGGSHEPFIGFELLGFPKIKIDTSKIIADIDRRKPHTVGTTSRIEKDEPIFITGYDGIKTTGDKIVVHFKNENIKKKDYQNFYNHPRPGHVDFVVREKYRDENLIFGSHIFSGRMTLPMVVAGNLCKQALNYEFESKLVQVGNLTNLENLDEYLLSVSQDGDSLGGIVEVRVRGVELGLGGPLFERLSAKIAQTVLSIPGTKGIEFGEGFNSVNLRGSNFNDCIIDATGKTSTNHSGGISGGISNGNELVVRVVFRPPASIRIPQMTYSFKTNKIEELTIEGRHDVAYVKRVLVVVENMIALALLDEKL